MSDDGVDGREPGDDRVITPIPARDFGQGCAVIVGILMVVASPVVFILGLEVLPRHGDGMGTIGEALYTAIGVALLGILIVIFSVVTARSPRSEESADGPSDEAATPDDT